MLPFAFPGCVDATEDEVDSRAAFLSGISPKLYDCCPKSCCCYVGPYADSQSCFECKQPRYNANGRPRKVFTYLPLIPRLLALCRDREMATRMGYRATYNQTPVRHRIPEPACSVHHHRSGQGKRNKCYCPNAVNDVFDGKQYRALCDTPVRISGESQSYNHFSSPHDIALALSTDGFTPFKRGKQTCWPIILYNLNLPPEERFKQDNIICVGVIPGPKKPKDIDSFLWPLVEELLQLSAGVPAFDAASGKAFTLRAYLVLGTGDIPAMSMVMRMKGHNAFSPCRMCSIHGVQIPDGTNNVYYIPLDRSRHPTVLNDPAVIKKYDPLELPHRTHTEFLQQAREVQSSGTRVQEEHLSKQYGIKGLSILAALSSLSFPLSFPFDFMHLFWENTLPNLVMLWTGNFKGLDEGTEDYRLSTSVLDAIGEATAAAGSTIPSVFGPRLPNFAKDRNLYTADMWSFWTLYLGPTLLARKFKHEKYHRHFVDLVRLLHLCLQWEITHEKVDDVRRGFAKWVEQFEEYVLSYSGLCQPIALTGTMHIAGTTISIHRNGFLRVY